MADLALEELRRKKVAVVDTMQRLAGEAPTAEDMPMILRALAVYDAVLTMTIIKKKEELDGNRSNHGQRCGVHLDRNH